MIKKIEVKEGVKLEDYESYAILALAVKQLQQQAAVMVPKLQDRTIWMINSTETGGGVAEMMPRMISIFRQLGLKAEWLVISNESQDFFKITKKIHNLIHGVGEPGFSAEETDHYIQTSEENAEELKKLINKDDIVIINDPQPMGMIKFIKKHIDVLAVWRCHIGLDQELPQTRSAWDFLAPFSGAYNHAVFSAPEYVPHYFTSKFSLIYPSIDPLDHKNRDLAINKLVGILCNAGLIPEQQPVLTDPFDHQAKRLQPDGSFSSPLANEDIGLMFRPVVTQISRWDRLKGFKPLMEGFSLLKQNIQSFSKNDERHQRRLEIVRLVLAGPDPDFVLDDPEGKEVLRELAAFYKHLPESLQKDIAILKLPLASRKENALVVNALQRSSTIVAQNSIQEGFGLTATEAMWKKVPVLVSNSCGLRQQVRDKIDGRLIQHPSEPEEIAAVLNDMLCDYKCREVWGYSAQKRAIDKFMIFSQVESWLNLLVGLVVKSG